MAARSFLILHGLEGSGPGHWQTWLAARLRADNERVAYPDLPDAEMPSLRSWQERLQGEIEALPEGEVVVVCHSLSCLLWLHHIAGGAAQADRVLLVAPPSEGAGALYGEPLGIPVDVIPGGGHLNPETGYGPWPAVEAWCLDGDRSVSD